MFNRPTAAWHTARRTATDRPAAGTACTLAQAYAYRLQHAGCQAVSNMPPFSVQKTAF